MAWSAEQMNNARLIIAVGSEMGMSSRDIMTGLIAAMQESGLRNVRYGDRDSLGLFQQRPSQGWGSVAQVTNPLYATRKFFNVLKGVGNRGNMPLWKAAQSVQRSAYPTAYRKWEDDAARIMGQNGMSGPMPFPIKAPPMELGLDGYLAPKSDTSAVGSPETQTPGLGAVTEDKTVPGAPGSGATTAAIAAPEQPSPRVDTAALDKLSGVTTFATGIRAKLIAEASKYLGTPYVWGGTRPGGFDCSGLIFYAYNKLGVKVPRVSHDQALIGQQTSVKNLVPGDLVAFGRSVHHIAIYLGGNRILESPHTGAQVRIRSLGRGEDHPVGVHLNLPGGGGDSTPNVDLSALGLGASTQSAGPLMSFPGI